MADINPIPLVACDNCGIQVRKVKLNGCDWRKPPEWGHIRISPAHWGRYPDSIDLLDICPSCIKVVHKAVSDALDAAKKPAARGEATGQAP